MLRKLTKKGDFTRILNPPVDSPVFGIHDQWVSYSRHAEWVMPQGLGRNQASRIENRQSRLQSFELAHWGGTTLILISFIGADRGYYLSSLNAHLQSEDRHQLLDNGRLLLRINTTDDLSQALSVLHKRHQFDPDTKNDLESSLHIKIALTHVDAKLYLLQGRFDEVYADCLTQSHNTVIRWVIMPSGITAKSIPSGPLAFIWRHASRTKNVFISDIPIATRLSILAK